MSTPTPGVAGWFPDPAGRHEHRWWDGTSWTDQVATGGENAIDALTGPVEPGAGGPPGPPPPPDYTGAQPTAAFGAPPASGGYDPPPGGFGGPPPPGGDPTVAFGAPPAPAAFGAPPPAPGTMSGAPLGPPTGSYGGPPPGPPAGGSSNKVPLIVAAVLVVAALIAGVVLLTGDDDEGNDVAAEREVDEDEEEEDEDDTDTTDTTEEAEPDTTDTTADNGLGGGGALGEETFSSEIVAGGLEVDTTDLSIAAGSAVVIRVAPEEDFDASIAILGDDAQLATFSSFAPDLAVAVSADPGTQEASPGVADAVQNFSFVNGSPTSELLENDAPNTDPAGFPPVVLFEEDPGVSGDEELFVLFAPEDIDVQLVVTGFLGSEGTFDAGVTFVEVSDSGDPAAFAAAIIDNAELATLLG